MNIPPPSTQRDRRSAIRHPVRLRAWLALRQHDELLALPALVLNISTSGALIETMASCRVGSLAYLSIPQSTPVLVRVARREGPPSGNRFGLAALHMPIGLPSRPWCDTSHGSRLDIPWPCSVEDIRRAYRQSAKRLHPDVGGTDAEFIELNREVNQMLSLLRQ